MRSECSATPSSPNASRTLRPSLLRPSRRRLRRARSSSTRAGRAPARDSSRCSGFVSSSGVCERPRRLWTKSITVGTPARATSAASCSGPDGRRCDVPGDLADRLVGELDQRRRRRGSARSARSAPTSTSMFSSAANRSDASSRQLEHPRELRRVEVALVEQLLGGLDDRGDDPRLADDAARRAHRAVADLGGDLADLERELRRAGERVAALVHRRRARHARPGRAR